ncbi:MAG: MFS transporter [Rhizobiaceae bacterium]
MSKADEGLVRWGEILNAKYALPLALVCLGVWLHAADELLLATMMPAMVGEIGGAELVSWNLALYEIGSIAAGAASGLMATRFGLRLPMAAAAALFGVGCSISALAPSMQVVLAGRLFQGVGGGGLTALAFVAVGLLFPRRLLARAMGALSALWGVSAFLGPLVGGLFVEYGTWRGGFWFFAAQALALCLWILFSFRGREQARPTEAAGGAFPALRLALLSAGVLAIAFAGINVSPGRTPLLVVAGLLCLAVFLAIDARRGANRLLPHPVISFRDPVGAGLTMVFFLSSATIAVVIYGPLLLTALHGISALTAGYVVACSSIGWTITAIAVSGMPERHDPLIIGCGVTMLVASIPGFVWSVPAGPVWLVAVFAFMEGGGFGLAWTFILRRMTTLAADGENARVSGAIPTVQRIGYAVGAAYIGIVTNAAGFAEARGAAETAHVARVLFLSCLPLALVGLAAAVRFITVRTKAGTGATEPSPADP